MLPMLEIHVDPEIWGADANEFKPERFLTENMESIHPYNYFPFSMGPRVSELTYKIRTKFYFFEVFTDLSRIQIFDFDNENVSFYYRNFRNLNHEVNKLHSNILSDS
jgi:Cytochrome P450